jgi:hypothetical protein
MHVGSGNAIHAQYAVVDQCEPVCRRAVILVHAFIVVCSTCCYTLGVSALFSSPLQGPGMLCDDSLHEQNILAPFMLSTLGLVALLQW